MLRRVEHLRQAGLTKPVGFRGVCFCQVRLEKFATGRLTRGRGEAPGYRARGLGATTRKAGGLLDRWRDAGADSGCLYPVTTPADKTERGGRPAGI